MVHYALLFTAELHGLTFLQPRGGVDDPDFSYFFQMKCENCGEISERSSCVILSEKVPLPYGKNSVHLFQKCKMCGKEGTVEMKPGQGKSLSELSSESRHYACLMVFECTGSLTPVNFSLGTQWKAQTNKGEMREIDLCTGEFADYDEASQQLISVSNMKFRLRMVKRRVYYSKEEFI